MAIGKIIFLAADMCGSPRPRAGGMLLGSTSYTYYTLCITCLPARGGEMSDHEAGCSVAAILRAVRHMRPRSCTMTVRCIYFAPITGYSRFTRNYCTHRPDAMLPGNVKENDPAVAWHGSLRLRSSPGSVTDGEIKDEAANLAFAFWDRIGEFVMRARTDNELSPDEKALWIQSGLAISPLMGTSHFAVLLGLLPSLGSDWRMDISGPLPCPQRPLA